MKRWPILLPWEILSSILLNSIRLGTFSCLLIQPYGNVFVIACPYWFFSSIFRTIVDIFFITFLPSILKSNNTFSFLLSSKISESKASLVLTQLKPPINVFSNTLTCSASVGSAIQHLPLSLWTQPLKEIAELHFRGL